MEQSGAPVVGQTTLALGPSGMANAAETFAAETVAVANSRGVDVVVAVAGTTLISRVGGERVPKIAVGTA